MQMTIILFHFHLSSIILHYQGSSISWIHSLKWYIMLGRCTFSAVFNLVQSYMNQDGFLVLWQMLSFDLPITWILLFSSFPHRKGWRLHSFPRTLAFIQGLWKIHGRGSEGIHTYSWTTFRESFYCYRIAICYKFLILLQKISFV